MGLGPLSEENFNVRDFLDTEQMMESEIENCEFWVTANRIVRETGQPNYEKAKIPVNNKWNFEYLERELAEYKDKKVLQFFKFGWELNAEGTELQEEVPRNQEGARENTDKVQQYLLKEREA